MLLFTKKNILKLPVYNVYSDGEYCKENSNLDVCKKWVEKDISEKEFDQAIIQEKNVFNEDNSFCYVIIVGIVILVCIIFVFMFFKKKKNVLD